MKAQHVVVMWVASFFGSVAFAIAGIWLHSQECFYTAAVLAVVSILSATFPESEKRHD